MLTQPVRDERVQLNDLGLHVVQWGHHGTSVVCVHGLTANAFCFQSYADVLAAHHRVIAYDLRGRGDSDKPEVGYSVPIHAADLAQLIEVLGLDKPVIVGHSLGAMIALYFAAHYPELLSKLVLVDAGAPYTWNSVEEQPQWLKNAVARLLQQPQMDRNNDEKEIPHPPHERTDSAYTDYVQQLKTAPYLGLYWSEYLDLYAEHDVYLYDDGSVIAKASLAAIIDEAKHADEVKPDEWWPRVQVSTLLLRAGQQLLVENDQLLAEDSARRIVQGIADCQYLNFPLLNHYTIVFDAQRRAAQAVLDFIKTPA